LPRQNFGHLNCSLFESEISKIASKKNPPKVDLIEEKKNSEFVRELIESSTINACHDISDGGLLVALFEMCNFQLGCDLDLSHLKSISGLSDDEILFSEDQSRYLVAVDLAISDEFRKKAEKKGVALTKIGVVSKEKIRLNDFEVEVEELIKLNEMVFEKKFS
jgi:phosphoribosylformylglycinamidine synthase